MATYITDTIRSMFVGKIVKIQDNYGITHLLFVVSVEALAPGSNPNIRFWALNMTANKRVSFIIKNNHIDERLTIVKSSI